MATRKGRGIDFEHRFRTSQWAEQLLLNAINDTTEFDCFRLGLSQTTADGTPVDEDRTYKEPDLIVFQARVLSAKERALLKGQDLTRVSVSEIASNADLRAILAKACCAIEVEFSPYCASEMKGRHWKRRAPDAKRKLPKNAKQPMAPNIWIKFEDLARLKKWETDFGVEIMVVHVFDQEAFCIGLSRIHQFDSEFQQSAEQVRIQLESGIFRFVQSYDRNDAQGAGESKLVFVVTPAAAVKVGDVKNVVVGAQQGLSASKKYVAHVIFSGGEIELGTEFLNNLTLPTAIAN